MSTAESTPPPALPAELPLLAPLAAAIEIWAESRGLAAGSPERAAALTEIAEKLAAFVLVCVRNSAAERPAAD